MRYIYWTLVYFTKYLVSIHLTGRYHHLAIFSTFCDGLFPPNVYVVYVCSACKREESEESDGN